MLCCKTRAGLWICGQRKSVAHIPTGSTAEATASFNLIKMNRTPPPAVAPPVCPATFVTKSLRHFYTDSENHSQGACSLLGAVNAEFRRARGASSAGCGHIAAVLRLGCEVAWPAVLDGDGAPPTESTSGDTISIISRPCASAAVLTASDRVHHHTFRTQYGHGGAQTAVVLGFCVFCYAQPEPICS